jgi:uncharacterized RDD family membrane protein YckC
MVCECGQTLQPNARFCTGCGRTVQASRLARPATEQPLPYAGFGRRVGAFLVDMILVYAVLFVAGAVWITQRSMGGPAQNALLLLLYPAVFALGWLYWAGMESSSMQGTLGKRAFGVVVTDLAGRRVSFGRATGRYFGKMLSGMTFYMGFLMAAFTMKRQALHDMLAGTLVLRQPPGFSDPASSTPLPYAGEDMTKPFYR